ncbi:hypothetical protein GCE9029_03609 [Grimontia celer]|uniref:Uncharacterized protein n=1 Tax=Grimontia celer TaxID=1796497 RepID=A0A128F9M2_9GAMM|nr:hypothetical protein GCE9029_03609 [Grimontia celer]
MALLDYNKNSREKGGQLQRLNSNYDNAQSLKLANTLGFILSTNRTLGWWGE